MEMDAWISKQKTNRNIKVEPEFSLTVQQNVRSLQTTSVFEQSVPSGLPTVHLSTCTFYPLLNSPLTPIPRASQRLTALFVFSTKWFLINWSAWVLPRVEAAQEARGRAEAWRVVSGDSQTNKLQARERWKIHSGSSTFSNISPAVCCIVKDAKSIWTYFLLSLLPSLWAGSLGVTSLLKANCVRLHILEQRLRSEITPHSINYLSFTVFSGCCCVNAAQTAVSAARAWPSVNILMNRSADSHR